MREETLDGSIRIPVSSTHGDGKGSFRMHGEVKAMDRKRIILMAAAVAIPVIVGLVLGYSFWGGEKKPLDYRQTLMDAAAYVRTLEEKNKDLATRVESLDAEVNVLRQKGQQSGTRNTNIITTLNQRVGFLEAENQRLKGQIRGLTHQADTTVGP